MSLKKFLSKKYSLAIIVGILMTITSIVFWVVGSPAITTVGENISVSGTLGVGATAPAATAGRIKVGGDVLPMLSLDRTANANVTGVYNLGVSYGGSPVKDMLRIYRGATDLMVINQDGNVGIGTSTPGAKLQSLSAGTTQLRLGYDASNYQDFTVQSDGSLHIAQDGGAATLALTDGRVGIGTTSPTGILHVKAPAPTFSATGGTITTSGGYTIHTFTTSGTFTPNGPGNVEVLVVAGGGGGGMDMGGGGGGGGKIYNSSYAVTTAPITVTVGAGGAGAPAAGTYGQPAGHPYTISAVNGQNSVFGTLTAIGGGRGGSSYYLYTPGAAGADGGSGGGASGYSDGSTRTGGAGTAGQGYRGGNGGGQYYSGGGGGAGGQGTDSTAKANGGIGFYSAILGTGYYWGGGGGGSGYSIYGGNGGIGGGGGGAVGTTSGGSGINNGAPGGGGCTSCWANTPGGNGGANTGGGGGGGSHYNANNKGGDGGSGIVIIRYPTPGVAGTLVVNSTGNVGIGTTAPTEKLEVNGIVKAANVVKADGVEVSKIISRSVKVGPRVCDNTYRDTDSMTFSLSGSRTIYIQAKKVGRLNTTGHHYIDMFVDGVLRDTGGGYEANSWRGSQMTMWSGTLGSGTHTVLIRDYCGSGATSWDDNVGEWPNGGLQYLVLIAQ